jgi:hypothetical protein
MEMQARSGAGAARGGAEGVPHKAEQFYAVR